MLSKSLAPYKPSSGDVIEFANAEGGSQPTAKISVGALQTKPCFRFDFTSFRVGCAATDSKCNFNVTGLSWDNEAQIEVAVGSQSFNISNCHGQCDFANLVADASADLVNLTSLLVDVTAGGRPQKWWADDLMLTWTDTSCEMAVCRSKVRDIMPKRGRRHGLARIFRDPY